MNQLLRNHLPKVRRLVRQARVVGSATATLERPEQTAQQRTESEPAAPGPAFPARLKLSSQLRFGNLLGRGGGQGAVFELPHYPEFVYKQYYEPIEHARTSFTELVEAGQRLADPLARHGIIALWPVQVFGLGDSVEGYVMPRMPDRFRLEVQTPYGRDQQEATLEFALQPDPGKAFFPVRVLSAAERIQLVRLVGVFLDTLHANDFVYGDLSLKNMRYATDPMSLLVMDMDGVHRISTQVIPEKDLANTPDWNDPYRLSELPLGFDLDRYKYALLVYRLLVVNNVSQPFPSDPMSLVFPEGLGLDSGVQDTLDFLLRRAASGGAGSRPPIREWLSALPVDADPGVRWSSASHRVVASPDGHQGAHQPA